ncbi:MAG: ATP-dependent RNA helicase, partial [Candidatus Sungbacteria bacterium]|nr:ATP-dependent RNA helicase [Candidatus Sungbacteria bacterium]
FMTDGILSREMQNDSELLDYEVIMVDEAHERSMNIDFILGLLKELTEKVSDLKVVVSSATIDADKFSRFFGGAPIINVSGRMYPVDIHYSPHNFFDSVQAVVDHIQMIHQSGEQGDILAFLAGVDQIKEACRKVEELKLSNLVVLPLYGEMSLEEQDKSLASYPGKRKAVIATNIAETSLTLDGVVFVVDSGVIKQTEYDHVNGIGILEIVEHSQAGCEQRAGRAGRTQPGVCYRLYTEENFNNSPKFTKPEIQRTGLAGIVLAMKAIGIKDIERFKFIDQPDPETFKKAHQTLRVLGALDENDELTDIGWEMADLPLDPKIGRVVVAAKKFNCLREAIIIASGLSAQRSVFNRPKDKEAEADVNHHPFKDSDSDFLTLLNVWRAYETSGYGR